MLKQVLDAEQAALNHELEKAVKAENPVNEYKTRSTKGVEKPISHVIPDDSGSISKCFFVENSKIHDIVNVFSRSV